MVGLVYLDTNNLIHEGQSFGEVAVSARRAISEIETSLLFVHRANIKRYEGLLQTQLTDTERAFILRRLQEERHSLAELSTGDPT